MGSIATLSNERVGFQEATQGLAELPRQGEGFDFERIYRMYSARVFNLCIRTVRDREEAEDLAQDASKSQLHRARYQLRRILGPA